MKKLILTLVLMMFAGTAFAVIDGDIPAGLEGFKYSKNVFGHYTSADTTGTGVTDVYSVGTKHASGNKNYHTSSTTTYMYQEEVIQTDPVHAAAAPATVSDVSIFADTGTYHQM